MKEIKLTQGYVALISDKDYGRVARLKWHAVVHRYKGEIVRVYAVHSPSLFLHRFILGINDPTIQVDHKDNDGLNCQRRNMRKATHMQNGRNRRCSRNNTSGATGVYWRKDRRRWYAQIEVDDKRVYLGYFTDKLDAVQAYNRAAKKYYGSFANLNKESK
jgi:hypothetical protein